MKIKNIYTNSKKVVIDYLLKYLCKENISYVRVEDEIYFLDKVYRFYDNEEIDLDSALEKIYNTINELELSKKLGIGDEEFIGITVAEGRVDNKYKVPYTSNKKRLIKMQNRRNNLKLKNSR